MTEQTAAASDDGVRIVRIIDEYLAEAAQGRTPDKRALLARHPELADDLEACLASLEFIGQAVHSSGPVTAAEAVQPAARTLGDFQIVREVGRGGMGVVYEARQLSLDRRVALKVLPFAGMLDPRQLQRFKNEAQAAAQLDHPNIVGVIAVGCERGVHYYAMRFVDGPTLAEVIRELRLQGTGDRGQAEAGRGEEGKRGAGDEEVNSQFHQNPQSAIRDPRFPTLAIAALSTGRTGRGREYFRGVAALAIQAAEALDHAHELGVLHRDVKPSNLILDAQGKLWVTDFGLARIESQTEMTRTGDLLGTLRYMSPEQALGKRVPVDHRSDVYSLGVTLYELLTLRPAFDGDDRQEVLRQVSCEDPRPPRRVDSRVPLELETIVLKAVEKNPADRFATAAELADDLRRFLDDQPIRACRAGLREQAVKWARRHQAWAQAAAAALFLVTVVSLAAVVLVNSARRNTQTALVAETRAKDETRLAMAAETRAKERALAAAAAEKEAKDTAQAREAETAAVLDFVESKVFAAGRPARQDGGLGRDVTMFQAVEAALPFIEKGFPTQPRIEARLRFTLGVSFWCLSETEKAAEQFQSARMLYSKHLGPDHPDTLRSMNNLANSYAALGRQAEALKLREETLELRKAKLGPDDPETLGSTINLAMSFSALRRHADAVKLYEAALAVAKTKMPDHVFTFRGMTGLANSYAALGRQSAALELREETLRLARAKLGPDHPDTLGTANNLANSYAKLGRHAEALKLREETLELRKTNFGPDDPGTLRSMISLACSYQDLGRHAEALKLHEETLPIQKAKLGPDHTDTMMCMHNMAETYAALGRHDEALELCKETLRLQKANLGPDHPHTLSSMNNLAKIYRALGRHAEALNLYEETLALTKAALGSDHPDTLDGMWGVAASLSALDRGAEAVPIIDECLRLAAGKVVDPRLIPGVMDVRLRHFAKCNSAAGCRTTAQMWEDLNRSDAVSLYNSACNRAITAGVIRVGNQSEDAAKQAAAEAERAMDWLKQAVVAGFNDVAHMKQDTDLEALRDRDDFRKLLEELEGGRE